MAEKEFDVLVANDINLSFRQSIPSSSIQVVLLKAKTYISEELLPLVEKLTSAIKANEPGKFLEIDEIPWH